MEFEVLGLGVESVTRVSKGGSFVESVDNVLELGRNGSDSDFHWCIVDRAFEDLACGLSYILVTVGVYFTDSRCHPIDNYYALS